jgi:hypothetical protein
VWRAEGKIFKKINTSVFGENELFKYYSFKLATVAAKIQPTEWKISPILSIGYADKKMFIVVEDPDNIKFRPVKKVIANIKGYAQVEASLRLARAFDALSRDLMSLALYCEFHEDYAHFFTNEDATQLLISGLDKIEVNGIVQKFL